MVRLLIGGSPCTYWSIAQKNNRETKAEGEGWELFKNYLLAKEKFSPDLFLYENNKSASGAIKQQIREELQVYDGTLLMQDSGNRYIEIDSALVSAQHRERFYVHNCGEVKPPKDRGILLRDILEGGIPYQDKSHCITGNYGGACLWNSLERHQRSMIAEPVIFSNPHGFNKGGAKYEKAPTLTATAKYVDNHHILESVRAGALPRPNGELSTSQAMRIYSVDGKSVTLSAGGGGMGGKTGLYAVPVCVQEQVFGRKARPDGTYDRRYEARTDDKCGTLTGTNRQNAVAIPVTPCGTRQTDKARCLRAGYATASQRDLLEDIKTNGQLGTTGVIEEIGYATPIEWNDQGEPTKAVSGTDGKIYTVYKVVNGYITIKGGQYPIRLKDGYYIIRKLTVKECCRLQTMPDDYCKAVSDTQAYKALGNGWTAEVIIHILWNALKNIPKHEQIVVLSMYDGIGTGRYCLDKMGFNNVKYFAYVIDKYAMQVAKDNYPDIIECGNAFQLRQAAWSLPI